jgi:hypothetical protein
VFCVCVCDDDEVRVRTVRWGGGRCDDDDDLTTGRDYWRFDSSTISMQGQRQLVFGSKNVRSASRSGLNFSLIKGHAREGKKKNTHTHSAGLTREQTKAKYGS